MDMNKILDKVNYPSDIKNLTIDELKQLCSELRDFIVNSCATNPGHVGSSLGAVDLVVALHYVYNTPDDKLVFDVGHQAYAHKIITGRKEVFDCNRKLGGISGFTKRSESPYDAFGAGHASTSISAALGFAEAERIIEGKNKSVAIIGDGALTGGLAYEGLNNAGGSKSDILVILNDNNISIDKNIGAMNEYLLKITTHPSYNKLKDKVWKSVGEGGFRRWIQRGVTTTKSWFVRRTGGDFFESMGFRYFGPIDGNDIEHLIETLEKVKDLKGPRILHILTKKGKGYLPAEENPTIWHAPGKYNPKTGEQIIHKYEASRYQDVFGQTLVDLATINDKVVGITPAMTTGSGMTAMAEKYPERFYDVGIAEEHSVTFSAGLAAAGLRPFCNIYSSFSQRAYDQIIHDVALQELPVVLCFDRAGLVGEDGPTHHGCYDIAAYRSIPGSIIAVPADELELRNMMYTGMLSEKGPFIIRYPRGLGEGVEWENKDFEEVPLGKGVMLKEGAKIAVVAAGPFVYRALEAANQIEEDMGEKVSIYNIRYVKPIDNSLLEEILSKYDLVITIEDGCLKGGLYSEVSELVAKSGKKLRVLGLGIDDIYVEQGSQAEIREKCGIGYETILNTIKSELQKSSKKV